MPLIPNNEFEKLPLLPESGNFGEAEVTPIIPGEIILPVPPQLTQRRLGEETSSSSESIRNSLPQPTPIEQGFNLPPRRSQRRSINPVDRFLGDPATIAYDTVFQPNFDRQTRMATELDEAMKLAAKPSRRRAKIRKELAGHTARHLGTHAGKLILQTVTSLASYLNIPVDVIIWRREVKLGKPEQARMFLPNLILDFVPGVGFLIRLVTDYSAARHEEKTHERIVANMENVLANPQRDPSLTYLVSTKVLGAWATHPNQATKIDREVKTINKAKQNLIDKSDPIRVRLAEISNALRPVAKPDGTFGQMLEERAQKKLVREQQKLSQQNEEYREEFYNATQRNADAYAYYYNMYLPASKFLNPQAN